jgi:hypothetical protein
MSLSEPYLDAANEVRGVVGVADAGVFGDLRIRAKRTGHVHAVVSNVSGHDPVVVNATPLARI